MPTKQEKGGQVTAMRTLARRAQMAFAVSVLVYRNPQKSWKWICAEVAPLFDTSPGAVAKTDDASEAFQNMRLQLARGTARRIDPALDLKKYVEEVDLEERVAQPRTEEEAISAARYLAELPGMGRGRKKRRQLESPENSE